MPGEIERAYSIEHRRSAGEQVLHARREALRGEIEDALAAAQADGAARDSI